MTNTEHAFVKEFSSSMALICMHFYSPICMPDLFSHVHLDGKKSINNIQISTHPFRYEIHMSAECRCGLKSQIP